MVNIAASTVIKQTNRPLRVFRGSLRRWKTHINRVLCTSLRPGSRSGERKRNKPQASRGGDGCFGLEMVEKLGWHPTVGYHGVTNPDGRHFAPRNVIAEDEGIRSCFRIYMSRNIRIYMIYIMYIPVDLSFLFREYIE